MTIVEFSNIKIFDLPKFTPEVKPRGRYIRNEYNAQVCAFDIETTAISEIEQSVMYVWQFAIEDFIIVGRTWEEFKQLIQWLNILSYKRRIIVFVHNLSYEFQFLSGIFHFENENVFAMDSRKVLKASINNVEFRCSYLLTNLNLNALTKRYGVEHSKLSGEEFDYSKRRYSDTPLTEQEINYCVNDVAGLVEAIHKILELNEDNLYTLPLTSTGFVRRICKKAMQEERTQILNCYPDYNVFKLLRRAFRGGNTHANRYYADTVITENVTSMDITSSYPFQLVCKQFPVFPFEQVKSNSIHYADRLIENGKAVIMHVALSNVELRNKYIPVPYIPLDKTMCIKNPVIDNGRVLSADFLEIVVTDIDWHIIVKQYTFSAQLVIAYKTGYGKLPKGLIDSNIEFYKKKTELKGINGQELFYMKNKELLNSVYGMCVQSPVKRNILFNDIAIIPELYVEDTSTTDEDLLIASRKRAFTCYQFGVWCTAHARAELQDGIDICGENQLLYCDTDSCKFMGTADFSAYNERMKQLAIAGGLVATDIKGITHYGGTWEHDGTYSSFITQGAKKYAYIQDGKIHITVSGVGKKKGAAALETAGGLNAFRSGFVFHHCGKTESIYNDTPYGIYTTTDGHEIQITRNVYIKEQDYTLSRSYEYSELISISKYEMKKIMELLNIMS